MGGHQRHAQAAAGQHHDDLFGMAFFGEVFGMTAEKAVACVGIVDDAFMQRRSHHTGKQAV